MPGPLVLRPLRERDFRLLYAGVAVSLIGDGITLVALAWPVYDISNDPAAATFGVAETMIGAGVLSAAIFLAALAVPGVRDPERWTEAKRPQLAGDPGDAPEPPGLEIR